MSNPIKYSTGSESEALKKGNMYIGTGSVGKGPSDITGYYQGPNVPSGGYVIYMNKVGAPGNLSYHSAANDSELISFTNSLANQNYTTVQQCFDYYYGQSDKVLVNQDYPSDFPYIVLDGLVLYVDAGVNLSYIGSGTILGDINGMGAKNNGTLTNGPTFNSSNGGSISFDGTNDFVSFGNPSSLQFNNATFSYGCWFYWANVNTQAALMGKRDGSNNVNVPTGSRYNQYNMTIAQTQCCGPAGKRIGGYISCDGGDVQGGSLDADLPNYAGWVHAFITINTTEQKLYINGVLSSTTTQNFTNKTFNIVGRSFYIGAMGAEFEGSTYYYFNNKIAVAQVYNKTLSSSEILQNFNAQKGRFGL